MDVLANPADCVSKKNNVDETHGLYARPCLIRSVVFIQEGMTAEVKPWPDSKSTNFCYQSAVYSHLCHIFAHPTSGWLDNSNFSSPLSHSTSSKLHSPLYTLINSQSTNTLPTLAMEDAVCFRGGGRSHLLKHMTGNPVGVQGSGAKGSLELGRVWKELSQKLRNLAQYKAC